MFWQLPTDYQLSNDSYYAFDKNSSQVHFFESFEMTLASTIHGLHQVSILRRQCLTYMNVNPLLDGTTIRWLPRRWTDNKNDFESSRIPRCVENYSVKYFYWWSNQNCCINQMISGKMFLNVWNGFQIVSCVSCTIVTSYSLKSSHAFFLQGYTS